MQLLPLCNSESVNLKTFKVWFDGMSWKLVVYGQSADMKGICQRLLIQNPTMQNLVNESILFRHHFNNQHFFLLKKSVNTQQLNLDFQDKQGKLFKIYHLFWRLGFIVIYIWTILRLTCWARILKIIQNPTWVKQEFVYTGFKTVLPLSQVCTSYPNRIPGWDNQITSTYWCFASY